MKYKFFILVLLFSLISQSVFAESSVPYYWVCKNQVFDKIALRIVKQNYTDYLVIDDQKVCNRLQITCPFKSYAIAHEFRPDIWPVIARINNQDHIRLRVEPHTGGMVLERWRTYGGRLGSHALNGTDWFFHFGECKPFLNPID